MDPSCITPGLKEGLKKYMTEKQLKKLINEAIETKM